GLHALSSRRIERLAQPPDVYGHGVAGTWWGMLAPELVDEYITMNRLVRVEQQNREQAPLFRAADVHHVSVEDNFERPEQAIVDHSPHFPTTVKHVWARADRSGPRRFYQGCDPFVKLPAYDSGYAWTSASSLSWVRPRGRHAVGEPARVLEGES